MVCESHCSGHHYITLRHFFLSDSSSLSLSLSRRLLTPRVGLKLRPSSSRPQVEGLKWAPLKLKLKARTGLESVLFSVCEFEKSEIARQSEAIRRVLHSIMINLMIHPRPQSLAVTWMRLG